MKKLLIVGGIALLLVAGGAFLYLDQQAKAAVKDLNANLPEGVRVEKSMLGNEYRVVNEIDRYDFKVPMAWNGLKEIEYIPEETVEGYTFSTVEVQGVEGAATVGVISRFLGDTDVTLHNWVRTNLESFGLVDRELQGVILGALEVIIAEEGTGLFDMPIYFLQEDSSVYSISNPSKDYIEEIILSGNW